MLFGIPFIRPFGSRAGKALRALATGLLLAAPLAGGAQADEVAAKTLFGRARLPAVSQPQSVGFYSKGCITGAVALPVDGPTWQAMRLERNRRWGHPALIGLLERLSRDAVQDGWPGLLVGDISQPRGGPMSSGHASHQVGLDADIWLTPMPNKRLSVSERANMSAVSMLAKDSLHVDPKKWTPSRAKLLKRAASYPEVQRIFVHPGIKEALCQAYGGSHANDAWLNKIRPYWGHYYHFHVRLYCQDGSPDCKPQQSTGTDNGCGKSLAWWFTDEPWKPAKPKPGVKPAKPKVVTLADLPKACTAILNAPAPADESLVTYSPGYDPAVAIATAVPVRPLAMQAGSRLPSIVPIPTPRPK